MVKVLIGLLAGLIAGYALWGYGLADPAYLKNLKRSEGGSASTYILAKEGTSPVTDQIAIVHGLIDDQRGCETMAQGMRDDGGDWYCIRAEDVRR